MALVFSAPSWFDSETEAGEEILNESDRLSEWFIAGHTFSIAVYFGKPDIFIHH